MYTKLVKIRLIYKSVFQYYKLPRCERPDRTKKLLHSLFTPPFIAPFHLPQQIYEFRSDRVAAAFVFLIQDMYELGPTIYVLTPNPGA